MPNKTTVLMLWFMLMGGNKYCALNLWSHKLDSSDGKILCLTLSLTSFSCKISLIAIFVCGRELKTLCFLSTLFPSQLSTTVTSELPILIKQAWSWSHVHSHEIKSTLNITISDIDYNWCHLIKLNHKNEQLVFHTSLKPQWCFNSIARGLFENVDIISCATFFRVL